LQINKYKSSRRHVADFFRKRFVCINAEEGGSGIWCTTKSLSQNIMKEPRIKPPKSVEWKAKEVITYTSWIAKLFWSLY
jgi:hypothetical protein